MEVLQKAKSRTIILYSHASPEGIPKESKSVYNKDTCPLMFIAALFTVAML
jgi:hypothetical protein